MRRVDNWQEEDLRLAFRKGDDRAFTAVYFQYWDKLLAIAYKHTKDKSDAKEIVQDVFVSLWNRREEVEIQLLESYLATAIKFAVFKTLARQKRHLEIETSVFSHESEQSLEEQMDALFLKEYLEGLVEELPERCRLIFRYSRDHNRSNQEIACELEISEKAVEANITRAIKKLRFHIKNSWFLLFCLAFWY